MNYYEYIYNYNHNLKNFYTSLKFLYILCNKNKIYLIYTYNNNI